MRPGKSIRVHHQAPKAHAKFSVVVYQAPLPTEHPRRTEAAARTLAQHLGACTSAPIIAFSGHRPILVVNGPRLPGQ